MDNKSYIGQEFDKGNKVYIIDDYDERAMCYDPKYPTMVRSKMRYGRPALCDASLQPLFESTLNGRIVTEQEYNEY